jgi:hypothetical protein
MTVDAINNLAVAQSAGRFKQELRKYHKPALVIWVVGEWMAPAAYFIGLKSPHF